MSFPQRTMNLGRISELKAQLESLRVLIHNNVTGIVLHFDPMDADLQYVERINPERLETSIKEVKKLKREFDKIAREIARLEKELGSET